MKIMQTATVSAMLIGLALVTPAAAEADRVERLPDEVFFGNPQISQLQISPDGRYLAMLQPANNRMNISVVDRVAKTKRRITDMKEENVTGIMWLNDSRLGFFQQYKGQESFGFYAVNADGTNLRILRQATTMEEERVTNMESRRGFTVIDYLPDDPDHILVNVSRGNSGLGDVYRLNVNTEKRRIIMSNLGKVREWLTDRRGVVRVAISTDELEEHSSIMYRSDEKSEWVELGRIPTDGQKWEPLAFDGDNRTLFIRSNVGRDTDAIFTYDPEKKEITGLVFADPTYDASDVIYSRARNKIVGVVYEAEKPQVYWLDEAERNLAAAVDAALPGTTNRFVSSTRDGKTRIIRSFSDRDPGTYYLLQVETMELQELIRANPAVNPAKMAEMRPISFKARDGLTIHAYLTLPPGRPERALPVIVNPHGGPFGIRDSWGFNPEVQFLANRGYAVLQVNYRGSGGYGFSFEEAGYRQWGLKMQDDLTDAVQELIKLGLADPERVAIYGASYGGYAALAGLVYTPELYRVGINYVGVSDIERLGLMRIFSGTSKPTQKYVARRWLHRDIDKEQIHATSPVNFIANIRVPSLHAYGKYDPRVTIDQGEVLEQQLKKHGKDYEYVVVSNEGHGFNKFENRIDFYRKVEAFLERHMPAYMPDAQAKPGPLKVVEMPAKTE